MANVELNGLSSFDKFKGVLGIFLSAFVLFARVAVSFAALLRYLGHLHMVDTLRMSKRRMFRHAHLSRNV